VFCFSAGLLDPSEARLVAYSPATPIDFVVKPLYSPNRTLSLAASTLFHKRRINHLNVATCAIPRLTREASFSRTRIAAGMAGQPRAGLGFPLPKQQPGSAVSYPIGPASLSVKKRRAVSVRYAARLSSGCASEIQIAARRSTWVPLRRTTDERAGLRERICATSSQPMKWSMMSAPCTAATTMSRSPTVSLQRR
jgi:hypothetical protein